MLVRFVTPMTLAEMHEHRKEIELLNRFLPFHHWSQDDPEAYMEQSVGELSLIYLNQLLIGCVCIELYKRSAEIHGIIRPDLKDLLGRKHAQRLVHSVANLVFEQVFGAADKKVLIAKIPPKALGALGFVRNHGFTKINTEKGSTVWRLTRRDFMERFNVVEIEES